MGTIFDTLKTNALIGLFALSSFAATTAQSQSAPAPAQKSPFENTKLMFLAKSYHFFGLDFNEVNFPSIFIKQQITPNFAAITGGYSNSNYTFSLLPIGGVVETDPIKIIPDGKMQMRFGLAAGIALYNSKFRYDTTQITATIPTPPDGKVPKNRKKHGREIMYYRMNTYDSMCACTRDEIVEVTRRVKPVGVGKKKPRFALFPTVTIDAFEDNGVWLMGVYGPGFGEEGKWSGLLAGGIHTRPASWFNH